MTTTDQERTLIILKPECLQRELVGEIVTRFERKGLKIVGMKMIRIDTVLAEEHYKHHKDKPFFESLKGQMTSAPVIVMALEGKSAISATRLIVGPTKGFEADAGSIRGDYSVSTQSNIVHASDSPETAREEIDRFFKPEELLEYNKALSQFINAENHF